MCTNYTYKKNEAKLLLDSICPHASVTLAGCVIIRIVLAGAVMSFITPNSSRLPA
jgi:hypothetical protein